MPNLHSATAPSGPDPHYCRGFKITLQTHNTLKDSSGRVISPSQIPLPTKHTNTQERNIHALSGIQTHNHKKRASPDLRNGPRGQKDRRLEALRI